MMKKFLRSIALDDLIAHLDDELARLIGAMGGALPGEVTQPPYMK